MTTGDIYQIPLPFPIRKIWNLPSFTEIKDINNLIFQDDIHSFGIILERENILHDNNDLSLFFSLCHCLEEIKPISLINNHKESNQNIFFYNIIFSNSNIPIIITYNNQIQSYQFWVCSKQQETSFINHDDLFNLNNNMLEKQGYLFEETKKIENFLSLTCIFETKTNYNSINWETFVIHDHQDFPLLCIFEKDQFYLRTFYFYKTSTENQKKISIIPSFELPNIKLALPICSTRNVYDIIKFNDTNKFSKINFYDLLVLSTSGDLSIYIGSYFICHCKLPKDFIHKSVYIFIFKIFNLILDNFYF